MSDDRQRGSYLAARAAGRLLSPASRRARLVVFCYHQVVAAFDPLRPGEPDEAQFLQDVRLIDRVFNVLTMGEAVRRLASGSLPHRAACITFDDGYADNFQRAAPILRSVGVPATFFITGGAVDSGVMWNDLVIESVARSGSKEGEALPTMLAKLKYLPVSERWEESVRLFRESGDPDLPRLMMTRDMVAGLSEQGFEIGGHTISHPILKEQPDEVAKKEIEDCATWIQDVTGKAPTTFAYPNGIPGQDFEPKHESMVRHAGFEAAASTQWSVAGPGSNLFAIPRVGPWWRQGRALTTGLCRSYLRSYFG